MSDLQRLPRMDLAEALGAWALRRTGSALLARALTLAARAESQGHACVRLGPGGEGWSPEQLDELAAHPWIGPGTTPTAAVLTTESDCFLWRNWRHEQVVAEALQARQRATTEVPLGSLSADLDLLFAGMDPDASGDQRLAVERAVGKRLFVLSGGPGTGKTTTVLRMLLMLLRQAAMAQQPLPAIALAAPTGKAAQRLSQALREGKAGLADLLQAHAGPALASWQALLAAIPDAAQTLHRLLGANPAQDAFAHDAARPLPHGLVVVDEASMVDLALMRALLDALAPSATLVLVGDPDQLVSVSAGSVLADLVEVTETAAGYARCARRLRHVWRAEQALASGYAAARAGDREQLVERLRRVEGSAIVELADPAALQRQLTAWLRRPLWHRLRELASEPTDAGAVLQALRQLQLLCALRSGPFGAEAINAWLDLRLREAAGGARWYPGRAVLIRHNDYGRRLFNGDIGVACGQDQALRVCFESVDADGRPQTRWLSPRELPQHDLAYALTIHQSQGSEYDHVAVLLPPDPDHPILSRQLLYTAISRARQSVELWCTEASLQAALARRSQRHGGLRERLRGKG